MNSERKSDDIVAIIPARGGSKGIPGKNLARVADKPLIAHTIEVALATPGISRVVVTTDCHQIAEVARTYGAEVPFLRPAELASDDAPGRAVWKHAIDWLEREEEYRPALTFCLQPTSPLRTSADLLAAMTVQREHDADWVVSVTKTKAPSVWLTGIGPDGRLAGYANANVSSTQRQSVEDKFLPNGALFLAKCDVLMTSSRLYTERTFAYVMPAERSLDIDTPWELHLTNLVMKDQSHARHS